MKQKPWIAVSLLGLGLAASVPGQPLPADAEEILRAFHAQRTLALLERWAVRTELHREARLEVERAIESLRSEVEADRARLGSRLAQLDSLLKVPPSMASRVPPRAGARADGGEDDSEGSEPSEGTPTGDETESPQVDEVLADGLLICRAGDELVLRNRFVFLTSYQELTGRVGIAYACPLFVASGYFFFFDPTNLEIPVKLLNACFGQIPPGNWFFAAGLTNFGVEISVLDLFSGRLVRYRNPTGRFFDLIIDQQTGFPCF